MKIAGLLMIITAALPFAAHSKLVVPVPDGRLRYTPDAQGNTIPDFSHCGYMGGGVAIPQVETKLTLHPDSYDWQFVPVEGGTFADSGSAKCH